MKPKHASPVACLSKTAKLIRSLRDDERVMSQETGTCKWLHVHDESEWQLMTALIRRFWFPYEQAAGRWGKCADHGRLAWTKCCSSRRNPLTWFWVCFLGVKQKFVSHTSNLWNKRVTSKYAQKIREVYLESSGSPAKSESWNSPSLHYWAVFPTWQYCLNHMTTLLKFTCVMNSRNQTGRGSVTSSGTFGDCSCKFVYWP